MKADPETQTRIQAETIAAISARCDGPNQFKNFDRAFGTPSRSRRIPW